MQATHEVVSARVETKGADAERGSHRQLLVKRGLYADMWKRQAEDQRESA